MEFIGQDTPPPAATSGARSPDGVVVAMLHKNVGLRRRLATRMMQLRRRVKGSPGPATAEGGVHLYRPGAMPYAPDEELEEAAATER